jgi:hypothetical protein
MVRILGILGVCVVALVLSLAVVGCGATKTSGDKMEGKTSGKMDGKMEGKMDGKMDGKMEGKMDSKMEDKK